MRTNWCRKETAAFWVVLAAGAVLGCFVWRAWLAPLPPRYPLPFGYAEWVATPSASPQGYFRKELFIPTQVAEAKIMLAATDSYILYINGRNVGTAGPVLGNVAGAYDIGPYLQPGRNVIGVLVERATYPGPARMAAEGAYRDRTGHEHRFASDGSWQASSCEESQRRGTIQWHEPRFLAADWSAAQPVGKPIPADIPPVALPPDVLAAGPAGKWLTSFNPDQRTLLLTRAFELPEKMADVRLRIAASGAYQLALNDVPFAARSTPSGNIDVYDVTPLLKRGTNILRLHAASGQTAGPPRVLVDGVRIENGRPEWLLGTDDSWQTIAAGQRQGPLVATDYHPAGDGPLTTALQPLTLPFEMQARKAAGLLFAAALAALATVGCWRASARLLHHLRPGMGLQEAQRLDALLHLPLLILLGAAFLLGYDSRFGPGFPFRPAVIALALGAVLGGRLLLIGEALLRRDHADRLAQLGNRLASLFVVRQRRQLLLLLLMAIFLAVAVTGVHYRLTAAEVTLSHDEAGMALFAKEILHGGAPVKNIGPVEKSLTTYELLPYPIAVSLALFGPGDLSVRVPALVFATATIILMLVVGWRIWNPLTGVLAASIYALSPFAILWGSRAFHPQQTQFFTLLTAYFFFRALHRSRAEAGHVRPAPGRVELQPRYLFMAAVSFVFAYLSWEGSGLLLIALFGCLLTASYPEDRKSVV